MVGHRNELRISVLWSRNRLQATPKLPDKSVLLVGGLHEFFEVITSVVQSLLELLVFESQRFVLRIGGRMMYILDE